jgi:hypothetical protein
MKYPEVSMETHKVVTRKTTLVLKECHVKEIIKQWAIFTRGFTRPII